MILSNLRSVPAPGTLAKDEVHVILADSGERYVDTIYSDAWVAEHFDDVASLWACTVEHGESRFMSAMKAFIEMPPGTFPKH